MRKKISVITGTRSEYGILRPVLKEILQSKKLELYLIVAGMHLSKKYGMTIKEIQNDGFKIYKKVNMIPEGDSTYYMAKSLGKGILQFSKIFQQLKPDINLILGDRDEPFAAALAASHMNIPNAHIHGGEISQGIDEYNRHAMTKISNIHFAVTKKSRERIIRMGENPKYVFLTGSPSLDEVFKGKISSKEKLQKKYNLKFDGNEILFLLHSVTTEQEETTKQISIILDVLAEIKYPTIAILPNSDAGSGKIFSKLKKFTTKHDFFSLFPNIPRQDFLGMLRYCGVLFGNSSSGLIEGSCFGIPVINVGIRQQNRERGTNVINLENISHHAVKKSIMDSLSKNRTKKLKKSIYGDGSSSKKIVKHLETIKIDKNLIQKQNYY